MEELKSKYQSVFNLMETHQVRLLNLHIQDGKLFIRASAPSLEIKHKVWDQIKLVDPAFPDLIADIEIPMAAAAAASVGSSTPARTYTMQPGDTLSKISKQFYGDANQFLKIFKANRDKFSDPDKIRPGVELVIP
ncbi:MAG: LysM peptidoglycan-binding domain-containing protein, partial [Acidobacteriota bacterium]|nr:LysM peptidoglycan-binding domain-containing protein [Acidobacteriota bacterium]